MRRPGPALGLATWTAALVVGARVLLAVGAGRLSIPLTSTDGMTAWVSDTPPADMAMAVLRLLALAATFYLLAVTALGLAARAVRFGALAAALDRVTPRLVHRLVSGGSGVGLVLGGAVGALPAPGLGLPDRPALVTAASGAAASDPTGTATMRRLPDATATMTLADAPQPTATMTRATGHPADSPATATTPKPTAPTTATRPPATSADSAPAPATTPAATGLPAPPPLAEIDGGAWVVEPGDSLWSIAEDVLAPSGASLDERTVDRFWRRLVAANRALLADPGNPDLLVPGQRLVVPPPG
jgi:LysM domain